MADASLEELEKLRFPDLPLIARPDATVPLSETTHWKVVQLQTLAELLLGKIIMIDDSPTLSNTVLQLSHPIIASVLFQGPITNLRLAPSDAPLATWDTMLEILQTFKV